jgi:acyl dehydratase
LHHSTSVAVWLTTGWFSIGDGRCAPERAHVEAELRDVGESNALDAVAVGGIPAVQMTVTPGDPKGRPTVPFDAIEPGQAVGEFSYTLDERTVERHLRATQQQRYPEPYAPVSILAADGVNLADRNFDISQSVHAGQKLDVLALPRLGSTLTVRGHAIGKFVKRGRRYVQTATETCDETGRQVARGVTTGVLVYAESNGAREPFSAAPPVDEPTALEALPSLERVMTKEAMILYEPEGERSIHTDDDFARLVGLPAAIATGTLFLAYIFDLLYRRYGFESVVGTAIDVRIRAPVLAGDRIITAGRVFERSGGWDQVHVECLGPRGPVISGSASVRA